MTYDDVDGYALLFGSGVWNYSRGNWTDISSTVPVGLTARSGPGLANDTADGYVLLFGGFNPALNKLYNDTWKYVGGKWSKIPTSVAPPPQKNVVMSYDSALREVVLIGSGLGQPFLHTWVFSKGVWKDISKGLTPNPSVLSFGGAADDQSDGYLILGPTSTIQPAWIFGQPSLYNLTVTEAGLPSGSKWSITLYCNPENPIKASFAGSSGTVRVPNGTYTVVVNPPSASGFLPKGSPTILVVNGLALAMGLVFKAAFVVTFRESGLPSGANWSVDVGGVSVQSTHQNLTFVLLNGSYGFTLGNVTGKSVSPANGILTISGSARTVQVRFT